MTTPNSAEERRGNPLPNLPSPDPSALTTENLHREVASLRELIEAKYETMAIVQAGLAESVKGVPFIIDGEVGRSNDLNTANHGFLSNKIVEAGVWYKERFDSADLRYQQRFDASGTALAAASLSAQAGITAAPVSYTH